MRKTRAVSWREAAETLTMSVQMRPNEDHEVLGSEFCSDYTDSFGKWNTGFHCPTLDLKEAVYCCGTSNYKYCCTKKDEVQQEVPNLLLMLGVIGGIIFAALLVILSSCFCCSCCSLYKKRQTSINGDRTTSSSLAAGPLYQLHCSSTASGVANMYSFSNQNSSVTTPVDTAGPHPIVDLDYSHSHLSRNGTSPSLLGQTPFAHNSPHLTRAVTVDHCHVPMDSGFHSGSPPCHGSSPSVSYREQMTKGERHLSCSPTSNGQPSVVTTSPSCASQSPSVARTESLYRSTKF